ncbi:MAG: polysaccharide deacetylase family protein [Clostridia bacterium]|nr:polysaccharide deacetylase family protein [Clostridia bacterium]
MRGGNSGQPAHLIISRYTEDAILKDIFAEASVFAEANQQQSVTFNISGIKDFDDSVYKFFAWNSLGEMRPISDVYTFSRTVKESEIIFKFPGYVEKVITFSYDDWENGDERLIELFNENGVKGTFNLITSRNGKTIPISTYSGHEVANHSYKHLKYSITPETATSEWPYRTLDEVINDIRMGYEDILNLTGEAPIGFVWPYTRPSERDDYDEIISYMKSIGVKHIRPVTSTNGEIYTYVEAIRSAVVDKADHTITNPSELTIYMTVDGQQLSVAPGETVAY